MPIALIPARSGSKRVPHKNIRLLNHHPLIAYTIRSAINANIFSDVFVCTDSKEYAEIARSYGAQTPALRPESISSSVSPDKLWVSWFFENCISRPDRERLDYAFILRPTSPFRRSSTILRAWTQFNASGADTLRAVRIVSEHPGKMWVSQDEFIVPILPFSYDGTPWHSNQTTVLPKVLVQDASLEVFSVCNFLHKNQITGSSILPFYSEYPEGLDINTEADFISAESIAKSSPDSLEPIVKF